MMYELLTANYAMNYQLIRIITAIIGVLIASYFDIFNRKNIPDRVLFVFLGIGLFITFVDFGFLTVYSLMITIIIGGIGYLAYHAGQIGAADILILMALNLLLPIQPTIIDVSSNIGTLKLPFILSIIIFSGITFVLYIFAAFTPKIIRYMKKEKYKIRPNQLVYSLLMLSVFAMFIYISTAVPIFSAWYLILITILIFASMYFTLFKEILQKIMITRVPIDKIDDQDVIAIEYMDKKTVKKYKINRVFRKKNAKKLKDVGLKTLPVYTGMPMFIPFVLIGLILSLILGDITAFMIAW